jgi:hypothetical protein
MNIKGWYESNTSSQWLMLLQRLVTSQKEESSIMDNYLKDVKNMIN